MNQNIHSELKSLNDDYGPLNNDECLIITGPANEILTLIAHAQKPSINTYADVCSSTRDINVGLTFHLNLYSVAKNKCSSNCADTRLC